MTIRAWLDLICYNLVEEVVEMDTPVMILRWKGLSYCTDNESWM